MVDLLLGSYFAFGQHQMLVATALASKPLLLDRHYVENEEAHLRQLSKALHGCRILQQHKSLSRRTLYATAALVLQAAVLSKASCLRVAMLPIPWQRVAAVFP